MQAFSCATRRRQIETALLRALSKRKNMLVVAHVLTLAATLEVGGSGTPTIAMHDPSDHSTIWVEVTSPGTGQLMVNGVVTAADIQLVGATTTVNQSLVAVQDRVDALETQVTTLQNLVNSLIQPKPPPPPPPSPPPARYREPTHWYRAGGMTTSSWTDVGTATTKSDATISGSGATVNANAFTDSTGAQVTVLHGGSSTVVEFGNIVSSSFSICTLTRYAAYTDQGRVLENCDAGANWLHGQHNGNLAVAHYEDWVTTGAGADNLGISSVGWVIFCGSNGATGYGEKFANGQSYMHTSSMVGNGQAPAGGTVGFNCVGGESSIFNAAEVMVWDTALPDAELAGAHNYLAALMDRDTPGDPDWRITRSDCPFTPC